MGLEYISQPQVFLQPITAIGGIQNGIYGSVLPPLYTSFYTWTSTFQISSTVFPLTGIATLTNKPGSFIVTVGGVLQSPTTYAISISGRTLTFDTPVNPNTEVLVTQIGTIATSALDITFLSAANSVFDRSVFNNVSATNLYVLSSVRGNRIEVDNSLLTNVTATNLRILASTFLGGTFFDTVTAVRFTALTSTVIEQSTIVTPTSVVNLTAVNNALFLGPVSATNPVTVNNNATVTGNVSVSGTINVPSGNSNNWNTSYNNTLFFQANSGTLVQIGNLVPTVANYLSTNDVSIFNLNVTNNLTVSGTISGSGGIMVPSLSVTSSNVFATTTIANLISALAINVNGNTLYLPLLSAI